MGRCDFGKGCRVLYGVCCFACFVSKGPRLTGGILFTVAFVSL